MLGLGLGLQLILPLVERLKVGAAQKDLAARFKELGNLTAAGLQHSPFTRVWAVEGWMPFQLKRLRAALRERGVGRLTVKKRGSPILPEDLIQQLKLEGEGRATLFLTQLRGEPIVIFTGDEL